MIKSTIRLRIRGNVDLIFAITTNIHKSFIDFTVDLKKNVGLQQTVSMFNVYIFGTYIYFTNTGNF